MDAPRCPDVAAVLEVLRSLQPDELRAALKEWDKDNGGVLTRNELRSALSHLGSPLKHDELEELFAFIDVDQSGAIAVDELLALAQSSELGVGKDGKPSNADVHTQNTINRVRASLLAFDADALRKMFLGDCGKLVDLSDAALARALRDTLKVDVAVGDVEDILAAMDDNNDGYVSYDELNNFLQQKAFADGIRTVLEGASRYMRARGHSLRQALLQVTRAHPAARAAGDGAAVVDDTVVPAAALRELLVDRLGIPLSAGQLDAVIAMADLDGSGDCDVSEVLYLAGEDEEGEDGEGTALPGVAAAGHVNNLAAGAGNGSTGPAAAASSSTSRPRNLSYASSSGSVDVADELRGYAKERRGHHAGNADDDEDEDANGEAASLARYLASCGIGQVITTLDDHEDDGGGGSRHDNERDESVAGESSSPPFESMPVGGDAAATAAGAWSRAVDAAFAAVVGGAALHTTAAATATPSSPPPSLDFGRTAQALSLLGLPLRRAMLVGMLARLLGSPDVPATVRVGLPAFRGLVDVIVSELHKQRRGRPGLHPIAHGRVVASIQPYVSKGVAAAAGAEAARGLLTRQSLACALASVPCAGLSQQEAIAVATYAPGRHRHHAVSLVHAHLRRSLSAAAAPLGKEGKHDGGTINDTNTSGGATLITCYPADPSLLTQASPPSHPDVGVGGFLAWLGHMAEGGAGVVLVTMQAAGTATRSRSNTVQDAPAAADAVASLPASVQAASTGAVGYASLDPLAREGLRKLCSGTITLPWALSTGTTSGTNIFGAATISSSSALALASSLPSSFRPSILACLSRCHPFTTLGHHLLDGSTGFEADPGNEHVSGAAAGLGLTLRMTSIHASPSPEDAVGCFPSFSLARAAQQDAATTLRPVGAAAPSVFSDASWAAEGDAVRLQGKDILTCVMRVTGCAGVPLPHDDRVSRSIVARYIRTAIADVTPPPDDVTPIRTRLLSNACVIPASWQPSHEDVWQVVYHTGSGAGKAGHHQHHEDAFAHPLVLRCDQPRDRGGPVAGGAVLVIELTVVFARAPSPSSSPAPPSTPDPMTAHDMHEEVTCAWGSIPLASLADGASGGASSVHRVTLTGGCIGAPADISPSDILQRRRGMAAAAMRALGGGATLTAPVITLQTLPLGKLKRGDRMAIGRLPFTIVAPLPTVPLLVATRQEVADCVLHTHYGNAPAPHHIAPSLPGAVVHALLSVAGDAGQRHALILAQALDVAMRHQQQQQGAGARGSKRRSKDGDPHADAAALAGVALRAWSALSNYNTAAAGSTSAAGHGGQHPLELGQSLFAALQLHQPRQLSSSSALPPPGDANGTLAAFRSHNTAAWAPMDVNEQAVSAV